MRRDANAVRVTIAIVLVAALSVSALAAQRRGLREVREWGSAGGAVAVANPTGQMGQFVDLAGGADLFLTAGVVPSLLGVRVEGAFLAHRLTSDFYSSTTSYVTSLRVGPQVTLGTGPVRLYGVLLGGISYFATTEAWYDCYCGYGYRNRSTLSGDVTTGWETGGGMQLRLGGRRGPVYLDLGARFVRHENARYLAPGPNTGSGPTWVAVEGPAEMVVYRLGVSVGLR